MKLWWSHLHAARAGQREAEQALEETRKRSEYINELAERDRESVRRNHFGEAIEIAMGRRRHA